MTRYASECGEDNFEVEFVQGLKKQHVCKTFVKAGRMTKYTVTVNLVRFTVESEYLCTMTSLTKEEEEYFYIQLLSKFVSFTYLPLLILVPVT